MPITKSQGSPEGDLDCAGYSPQSIAPNTPSAVDVDVTYSLDPDGPEVTRQPVFVVEILDDDGVVYQSQEFKPIRSGLFEFSATATVTAQGISLPRGDYTLRVNHLRTSFPGVFSVRSPAGRRGTRPHRRSRQVR